MIDENIVRIVQENIPNWQAIMIIRSHKDFDVIGSQGSPFADPSSKNFDLYNIASLVAFRFGSLGFNELLDGLETTINLFGSYFMFTTTIDGKLITVIFPKNENITEAYGLFNKIASILSDNLV